MKAQYEITVDLTGSKYLGLKIEWNYDKKYVEISMPDYIGKALIRFAHAHSTKRQQHAPHQWNVPQFGVKGPQYMQEDAPSEPLPASGKKLVQQVLGTFLYYALEMDLTMLVALGTIASQQSCPTERTMSEITWFLDYFATYPDATIRYQASDMVLWMDRDAS